MGKSFFKKALEREGKLMSHCVGSYCDSVKSEQVEILSLRDENNIPHCTVEYTKKNLQQIKGNSNGPIKSKYIKYVKDLIEGNVIKINGINNNDLNQSGLLYQDKILYNLYELPENFTAKDDLDLSNSKITSLPVGLKVGGYLDLRDTNITSLPDNLEVGGDLDLSNTKITSLPAGLKVGGSLYLCSTNITSLPDDFKIRGSLNLYGSKITSLPTGLKVGGGLYLNNTEIASLPAGLKIGGYLDLRDTKITSLPTELKVGGKIYKDF